MCSTRGAAGWCRPSMRSERLPLSRTCLRHSCRRYPWGLRRCWRAPLTKSPSFDGFSAPRVSKRAAQPYPASTRRRLGADQPAGECALPKMPRGWPGAGGVAEKEAAKQAGQKGLYGGHGLFNPRQPCIVPPAARRGSARRKPSAPRVSAPGRPSPAPRRQGRGHGFVPHRR